MSRSRSLLAFLFLALLLVPSLAAEAAPLPPLMVVNHETHECARVFAGDECMDCAPPAGWQSVGVAGEAGCPEGYTLLDQLDTTCTAFQVPFCCTQGHSGAAGDCEAMVINERVKECTFVEAVETCQLRKGWGKRPDGVDAYAWLCPDDYAWVTGVACEVAPPEPEAGGAGGFCPSLLFAGPGLLAVWCIGKRNAL